MTILWNEVTIWWNEVTLWWNEVVGTKWPWNEVTVIRTFELNGERLLEFTVATLPQIFRGASSSNRTGWFKKISLDFRHSPRTSDSVSCTFFPGRLPRTTKANIKLTSCQEKVKEKVKDMKCSNLLTGGILCDQHSSRPPPYQLSNENWPTDVTQTNKLECKWWMILKIS